MERHILMKTLIRHGNLIVLALACSLAVHAKAADYQKLADSIAGTLGYPSNRLTITDMTNSPKAKARGGVLAGVILEAKDGSFATMAIGVARRGVIFKPGFEAECEEAVKKGPSTNNTVSKIILAKDAYGYIGLGILGPGGSAERIVATWPSRGIDMQISITLPSEGLVADEVTKNYQKLVNEGGAQLVEKLTQAMNNLVAHVEKADIRGSDETENTQPKKSALNPGVATEPSSKDNETKSTLTVTREEPTSSTPWSVIAVLIVAAIGLLWLLVKNRK